MGDIAIEQFDVDHGVAQTHTLTNDVGSTTSAFVQMLSAGSRATGSGPTGSTSLAFPHYDCGAVALTGTDELSFYASHSTVRKAVGQVWRYTGAAGGAHEFKTRGSFAISLSGTSATAAVSGIVDEDACVPFLNGVVSSSAASAGWNDVTVMVKMDGSGNVEVSRNCSDDTVTVYVTVVEFTGSAWSVGHGAVATTGLDAAGTVGGNSQTTTLKTDSDGVSGTTFDVSDWSTAFIVGTLAGDSAEVGISDGLIQYVPGSSTTTVDAHLHADANARNDGGGFVHVIQNDDLDVTRDSDITHAEGNGTWATVSWPSGAPTNRDLDELAIEWFCDTSGVGTAHARGALGPRITDATGTASAWVHRSGNNVRISFGVIDVSQLAGAVDPGSGSGSSSFAFAGTSAGSAPYIPIEYRNTSEGGTDATTITGGNSGGDSGDAYTLIVGSPSYTDAESYKGTYSVDASGAATAQYVGWYADGDTQYGVFRGYFMFDAAPSGATQIARMYAGASNDLSVNLNTSRTLTFTSALGGSPEVTSALSVDTWYRLEIVHKTATTESSADGWAKYYVYEGDSLTPVTDGSYSSEAFQTRTGYSASCRIGKTTSSTTLNIYWDDLAYDEGGTSLIGPSAAADPAGSGAGSGSFSLSSSADGESVREGTGSGSFSVSSSSSGAAQHDGGSAGALAFASSASGASARSASTTAAVALSGSADGHSALSGSTSGVWAVSGAAQAESLAYGAGSSVWAVSGAPEGIAEHSAASSGDVSFAATSTGGVAVSGASTSSFAFAGTAGGSTVAQGGASGSATISSTADGAVATQGDGSGAVSISGTASGSTPSLGVPDGGSASTFALHGTASGEALHQGGSSGAHTLYGTADGETVSSGAAGGTSGITGTASGAATAEGSTGGTFATSGGAAGAAVLSGTASGAYAISGFAVAGTPVGGTASGTAQVAGAAAGSTTSSGDASSSWAVSAAADGQAAADGSGAGALVYQGASSGAAPAITVPDGASSGGWSITGTGSSTAPAGGTSSGALAFGSSAAGSRSSTAPASSTFAVDGASAGATDHSGSGSATVGVSASGAGEAPPSFHGSATSLFQWAAAAAGEAEKSGTGFGVLWFQGTSFGVKPGASLATGSWLLDGTATGTRPKYAAVSGSYLFTAAASGIEGTTTFAEVWNGTSWQGAQVWNGVSWRSDAQMWNGTEWVRLRPAPEP